MAAQNFIACLNAVLEIEGGFSDDKQDPGGATNLGVTLSSWSGWVGHPATIAEIEALTPAAVGPLYQADFWNAAHCPALPIGIDMSIFDIAVNSGVGHAIRALQGCAGATIDGLFGPGTLAAVNACKPLTLISAIALEREAFYRSLPTFSRFGDGWLSRVRRVESISIGMVHG